jgi:hypothetical protein
MSVYVDDFCIAFRGRVMCHMLADTDAELRDMAERIGMQQRWHQGDHFDVDRDMRARAVQHGAQEITRREAVLVRRRYRDRKSGLLR